MTCLAVLFVEINRVALLKALHDFGQRTFALLHQKMDMIRHENIRVERAEITLLVGNETILILSVIFLTEKDLLPLVAPDNHMIKGTRILHPKFPGHDQEITDPDPDVNIELAKSDPKSMDPKSMQASEYPLAR